MSFQISNVQYCVCETNSMFSYLMMSLLLSVMSFLVVQVSLYRIYIQTICHIQILSVTIVVLLKTSKKGNSSFRLMKAFADWTFKSFRPELIFYQSIMFHSLLRNLTRRQKKTHLQQSKSRRWFPYRHHISYNTDASLLRAFLFFPKYHTS